MSSHALNILEVIENLTTLVDAESLEEIEVTPDDRLVAHKENEEGQREIYWVSAGPDDQTMHAIKRTFHSVHQYLQHSFNKIKEGQDPKRFIEGVGTIMVLVGEATKKLERLGLVFKERLADMSEYRELQDFYKNTVLKNAFARFAKDLALKEKKDRIKDKEEGVDEFAGVHLLNNIDLIKGDTLYELFYLMNEEGHHFYTRDLARNVKLACDFGEFSKEYSGDDPLLQIKNWEDKSLQLLAKKILHDAKGPIRKFYKEAMLYKRLSFVILLNNALMALMLSSNTRNLIRQFSLKGSHRYFFDFQHFLREILQSRDFQRELLYPSPDPFFMNAAELIRSLCYSLFTHGTLSGEVKNEMAEWTHLKSMKEGSRLSEVMKSAYHHLQELFAKHPSGPLFKALDLIREEDRVIFDPYMQGNLAEVELHFKEDDQEISLLRLACPTMQEVISKAYIVDEFKEYLRAALYKKEGYHHLIINFQDKTSWREHARSVALEELSTQAEFADLLTVVTLSKDGEFYHQSGVYESLSKAQDFIGQLKEHLADESTGYYFPKEIQKILFPDFIDSLCEKIYSTFFHHQDLLSKQDRQNFIELLYAFLEWKLMEESHCSIVSLASKDGLDSSATASLALVLLLKLGNKESLRSQEIEQLIYMLFGQTMIVRERLIHADRFQRLLALVELLESSGAYLQPFYPLFKEKIEVLFTAKGE